MSTEPDAIGTYGALGHARGVEDNRSMTGIQFVTDDKGRKVAVVIGLEKQGARLQDFWDGLISKSRRKEKGIPLERVKAGLVKRGRLRE
jgi:hypothetical protein